MTEFNTTFTEAISNPAQNSWSNLLGSDNPNAEVLHQAVELLFGDPNLNNGTVIDVGNVVLISVAAATAVGLVIAVGSFLWYFSRHLGSSEAERGPVLPR
jgi:hypothetical protein